MQAGEINGKLMKFMLFESILRFFFFFFFFFFCKPVNIYRSCDVALSDVRDDWPT